MASINPRVKMLSWNMLTQQKTNEYLNESKYNSIEIVSESSSKKEKHRRLSLALLWLVLN